MKTHHMRSIFIVMGLMVAAAAQAQYQWRDQAGRMVYSDQPPPANIPAANVIKGPRQIAAPKPAESTPPAAPSAPSTGAAPAAPGGKAAAEAPKTTAEKEMDFRKRQQEQAEANKKKQEEDSRKQRTQQACESMKGYERSLADGVRVSQTSETGERRVMEDAERQRELARVRKEIAENCK